MIRLINNNIWNFLLFLCLDFDGDGVVGVPVLHHLSEGFVLLGCDDAVLDVDIEFAYYFDGAVLGLPYADFYGAYAFLGVADVDGLDEDAFGCAWGNDFIVVMLVAVTYTQRGFALGGKPCGVDVD